MNDYSQDSIRCCPEDLNGAMPIHTRKITDSCRDKDCIEDLRVYLTRESQNILDSAASAKVRSAELLCTAIDVTPVAFNRNHYCIDLTFYYRIIADAAINACRPACLCGLALFSKRAVLCGERSDIHIFTSDQNGCLCSNSLPTAVVEVLDPIVLSSKLVTSGCQDPVSLPLPEQVQKCFDDDLVPGGETHFLSVTLGQFSIIRLEREARMVVPVLDYSIPTKECRDEPGCCAEDPCEVFSRIPFPADSFTPGSCESCGS